MMAKSKAAETFGPPANRMRRSFQVWAALKSRSAVTCYRCIAQKPLVSLCNATLCYWGHPVSVLVREALSACLMDFFTPVRNCDCCLSEGLFSITKSIQVLSSVTNYGTSLRAQVKIMGMVSWHTNIWRGGGNLGFELQNNALTLVWEVSGAWMELAVFTKFNMNRVWWRASSLSLVLTIKGFLLL